MRYLKLIVLCGMLFSWALPLQASAVKGLYEAEVEVADQGRESRAAALAEAMAAVLVKVSGSTALLEEEVIRNATVKASRYVQQYRYRSETPPETGSKLGDSAEGVAENRLLLWASFDPASIDNLLRGYGFSVWSGARPGILVWLVVEDGAHRVLVGANDQGLVREVLDSEAERRAIVLHFPLLDLKDQSSVRPADVWGGFIDIIEAASQRYEPQAMLLGKLYSAAGRWQARWTLHYQGEQHSWQQGADDVKAAISSGVGGSADYLSRRFAENGFRGSEQVAIRVDGVSDLSRFRRVSDYLHSLNGVTIATLRRADDHSASFLLEVEGGSEGLLQAIALGDVLVRVEEPPMPQQPEVMLMPPAQPQAVTPAPEDGAEGGSPESSETLGGSDAPVPQPQVAPLQELLFRLLS